MTTHGRHDGELNALLHQGEGLAHAQRHLSSCSPTELKVAQLVSSGLSNMDVAVQCWVSPRTVAFHLRNVFAMAGVTSRGELAQLQLVQHP